MEKDLEEKYRGILRELSFLICLGQLKGEGESKEIILCCLAVWDRDRLKEEIIRSMNTAIKLQKEIKEYSKARVVDFNWDELEQYLNRD